MYNQPFFNARHPLNHYRPLTTFDRALPYGVTTSLSSLSGAFLTLAATSTAVKVTGIFIAITGVYAFLSVILCGIKNSDNPMQFQREIHKALITSAGTAVVSIVDQIARSALDALIDKLIYGNSAQRVRFY